MANAFETECKLSAQALGLHYQKVSVATVQRRGRTIPVKDNNYDSYIVKPGGLHVALELKSLTVHDSFPLGNIEEHQLTGLQEMLSLGCPAYLLFNMRSELRGKKLVSKNQAWALEFGDYTNLLLALPPWRGKPRRSIPREMFDDTHFFQPLPRLHVDWVDKKKRPRRDLCWDLRTLL